ncbi:zinc finger BED domain-containing protein 6-like [Pelodytes ibericus]
MSVDREEPAIASDFTYQPTLPKIPSDPTDRDGFGGQYPRPSTCPRTLTTAQTALGPNEPVPEIEIKLESSDDDDEIFEKNADCSLTRLRDGVGVSTRSSQSPLKERLNFPVSGKGHRVVEELSKQLQDNPSLSFSNGRPIRKRKPTSDVWQFFYRDANNICRAICSICRISVSRGKLVENIGTSALKRHLMNKHPVEWAQRGSTRLQRGDEDEEAFEEEEEKEEPYEKVFCEQTASYNPEKPSQRMGLNEAPESPKTYEIIDSSDEEDGEKGSVEKASVASSEENERKRLCPSAKDEAMTINPYHGFTLETRLSTRPSMGMANTQYSTTSTSNLPSYPLGQLGTKRRKSTSAVWQFFYIDHTNICRAICTLCQLSVSRGKQGGHFGTSALMRHLEGKHPVEWGRGKLNKPNNSVIEVEEEEEEEPDEQVEPFYPQQQQQAHFEHLRSPCSLDNLGASTSLAASAQPTALENDNETEKATREQNMDCTAAAGTFSKDKHMELNAKGKYSPNHPKAQAWNRNIAELMCGLVLPFSVINSKAFQTFMERADPMYSLPSRSFFSGKAVPRLYEAVCEKVASELKRSECTHVHMAAHVCRSELPVSYMSLTAHWTVFSDEAQPAIQRKFAALAVKCYHKDITQSNVQQEIVRQVNTWLSPNALSPGFFICSGDFNLLHVIKGANFSHISSFTHTINLLVMDFLQNNHYISSMLGVARKVCSHFIHSARAGRILGELQYQCNLPKQRLKLESAPYWTSTFFMLQRLLEQQRAVQEYFATYKLETVDILLTPSHWSLMVSLVYLLQPFEMATREVNANASSLSQVLPEVRYLHIFVQHVKAHFESKGDANGVVLADSFALKLSTDCKVNEIFQREEYVLSTLLDPRFKGRIEAILPSGSDIDYWKQVLVKKVKDVMMSTSGPLYVPSHLYKTQAAQNKNDSDPDPELMIDDKHYSMEEGAPANTLPPWGHIAAPPLIQKEKSLIEHLESVGLMASKRTGALRSTESHSACVMVEKYLQDNKTIGAKEDPLGYWRKRKWLWPDLTKIAIMYLTCPPSSISAQRVIKSPRTFMDQQRSSDMTEGTEQIAFLKANLGNFPHYVPPPLIFSSDNETDQSDSE